MTINEQDWVIHPKTGNCGQVLEIADGVAYLELENGVEMDFPVSELVLESEYKTPHEQKEEALSNADEEKKKVAEEIWPLVRDTLAVLTERYAEEVAVAVKQTMGGTATPWNELSAYHKMNYLVALTGTSFEKWEEAHKTNTLARLQLTVMMVMGQNFKKNFNG